MNSADATARPAPHPRGPGSGRPGSRWPGSGGPGSRGHLAWLAVAAGAAGLAALAGCGSSGAAAGGPPAPASAGTPAAATATSAVTPAAGSPAVTPPARPTVAAGASSAGTPVLGRLAGVFARGSGFGQARPAEIFNGGDPTGLVTKITWQSWGGATATGTGTTTYVPANEPVADGRPETATVVAFDLGTCGGTYMYQAVEWYFPQHGQSFSAGQYENVCTGSYVPSP
jgi:hypothetical protein